jgi:hypothetical protein
MRKPKVTINCVASHYAGPDERIIEFSSKGGGGLIAFRVADDGRLLVDVYRQDRTVKVRVAKAEGVSR